MTKKYVVGVDYGSDSARAVIVNTSDGQVEGSGVAYYPRWNQGLYQHPEKAVFRQHPLDYLEALEKCVKDAVSCLGEGEASKIVGIGVDTTGSTPVPVDRSGVPLSLKEEFLECENAMFHLWKDHSAVKEAEEINRMFRTEGAADYTKYQGKYSSEWYWAKILHTVREDERIRQNAYSWVEHCDWMVGILCGKSSPEEMYHSACAAGHKALWHSEWNGLPDAEVLERIDPYLKQVRENYGKAPQPSIVRAGFLTKEWSDKLGIPEGISVSGSSFDAHAGAVGAGIREKNMICTLGTSAVDMLVAKAEDLAGKNIRSFGGQAEDSILPGYIGIETGQAAFGDIFAWFKRLLTWPLQNMDLGMDEESRKMVVEKAENAILAELQIQAEKLPVDPSLISLDWFNGRRYPNTDDAQKSVVSGLTLGTQAPELFRSLVFGAVCGLKRITEGFEKEGIEIENLIAVGGISKKSDFVMQMMSDVLEKRISILDADQTCALGAAIYAAVAADVYESIGKASENMAAKCIREFVPDNRKKELYENMYQKYLEMAKNQEV